MRTEREKMVAGELYHSADPALTQLRIRARELCDRYNRSHESDTAVRHALLVELLARGGDTASIQPPFHCDYGFNLSLGESVFINFNCIVLDVCPVTIGAHAMLGPSVQLYTATHPMTAQLRRTQELGRPLVIGADVWIGGGAMLCPGVTVGDGTVIGAGSVVTRSIPAGVFAAGNPCRVIRRLPD